MKIDSSVEASPRGSTVGAAAMDGRVRGRDRTSELLARLPVLPVLLVLAVVVFALANERFLSARNLIGLSNQATFLIIVALGQALVLLSGGFDLSVGATVGLSSVVTATVLVSVGSPVLGGLLALACGVGAGAVIGVINGVSVSRLGVPPFIVTLGASTIAMGVGLILSKGIPVINLPSWFVETLGTSGLTSVSFPVYVTVIIAVVVWAVVARTTAGRSLYAVGGNAKAARLSGIRVERTLLIVYVASGCLAGVAGILMSARVATGDANLGAELVMASITACVLAGVSLRGGEGKIGNVVIGALFVTVLSNGMNLAHVQTYYQMVVLGVLLVLAVITENVKARALGATRAA